MPFNWCAFSPIPFSFFTNYRYSMEQFLISLLFLLFFSPSQLFASINDTMDFESLVAFKNQLLDQSKSASSATFMSSWNETNPFCSWEGVTCGHKHSYRVTALNLSSIGLAGPLPPSVANLTFLQRLDLSNNELYGEIPLNLARLQRLQHLNLSFNSFHGDIPAILVTNNSVLQVLDLSCNKLTGKLPHFINSMSPLNYLDMDKNNISGNIPPSIGNLTFLEELYATYNNLEGEIPVEIGGLRRLQVFRVGENNLLGNIPSSFYNLSSLRILSLANNHLSGNISVDIAQAFPNLEILYIARNHLAGSLKILQNVTSLVRLDISINNFTGVVPPDLGKMQNLVYLNMARNELKASDAQDWRFIDSLTNCTSLEMLSLYLNNFGGVLPKSFWNLSIELRDITLGRNNFSGSIPLEVERYTNLINFGMEGNLLNGFIPESIGKLKSLQVLSLDQNNLHGIIPYSLCNLTILTNLWLAFNQLSGTIPPSIQNLQNLNDLDLKHNKLTGLIPKELFLIHSLSNTLYLSYNSFTGSLPSEVGNLVNIMLLDFSHNKLNGEIPESLGSCQLLLELYMDTNFFYGPIPSSLSNMKSLEMLDLSHNNFSGSIPQSLQNLTYLKYLDLSFNNIEGEVPYNGVFANFSTISLTGNENICGGIPKLHLPKCVFNSTSTKRNHHLLIKIIFPILSMLVLLLAFLVCYTLLYKKQKQSGRRRNLSNSSLSTPFPRISYAKLAKATNGFANSYLVGNGQFGSVYKGTLRDYQDIVAIKVFKLEVHGAFKSFISECDTLRSIRHRNLVRILTSCSSVDRQGRDFKALIFEFMPKGNLDMWLHRDYERDGDDVLSLEKRLNIIINIADALEYLHHSCEPSIIHCDMKPSNILLDNDMIAHIGDFGLSRMISEAMSMTLQDYSDKSGIKGTVGYVAPEYAEGARPSTSTDVYSFGIILLEMLTGRRPTDDSFKDNLTLYNHVKMVFPHRINDIIDLKMFTKEQIDANKSSCPRIQKCLLSLAEVGLLCSTSLSEKRPCMREVATKLHAIGVSYLQSDENNGVKL